MPWSLEYHTGTQMAESYIEAKSILASRAEARDDILISRVACALPQRA